MKYELSINLKAKGNVCQVFDVNGACLLKKEEAEKIDPLIGQLVAANTRESVIQILKDLEKKFPTNNYFKKRSYTRDLPPDVDQKEIEMSFTRDATFNALYQDYPFNKPKLNIGDMIQLLELVNQEEELKEAYNPFREIFAGESHTYPHARTLRTGLWQKLKDTYFAFSGSFFGQGKEHLGLFDYLTLGLSHYINLVVLKNLTKSRLSWFTVIIFLPVIISFLALNIIRYVAAGIFALAMSPLVIAIHGVAKLISLSRMNDVEHLTIQSKDEASKDLSSHLKDTNLSLEDLGIKFENNDSKVTLEFHREFHGPSSPCHCCSDGKHVIFTSQLELDDQHPKDKKTFKALVELNIGGLARELERKGVSPSFFEKNPSSGNQEKEAASATNYLKLGT